MKFKRNLLLASLIAIGTVSFASAQETNKMQQRKMERVHQKESPTFVKKGVLTVSTTNTDGKSKIEKIDLSGKSIDEAIGILKQKRGEGYGEYNRRKGNEKYRQNQGTRGRSNKMKQNKLQQNKN